MDNFLKAFEDTIREQKENRVRKLHSPEARRKAADARRKPWMKKTTKRVRRKSYYQGMVTPNYDTIWLYSKKKKTDTVQLKSAK